VGSIRSPLWRHGGTVHGPQPRSYDYAFPRKKLLGALRSALAAKLADGKLVVVESFEVTEPKSKQFRQTLHKLNAKGTTLLVESSSSENHNLHLSSRNLAGVELLAGNQVHPYHLLRYETTIFARPALEKLQDSLKATAPKHPNTRKIGASRGPGQRKQAEVA
jgi:large subunit ribosomal protein L4